MSGILGAMFGGSGVLVLDISNTVSPNIGSLLLAAGWDAASPVRLEVSPGALVNTLAVPGISFPAGIYLYVGAGARIGGVRGAAGMAGGVAFSTAVPILVENYGVISGGGGGGGGGGTAWVERYGDMVWGIGGAGGDGQGFINAGSLTIIPAGVGSYGTSSTTTATGGGTWGGGAGYATATGGAGGAGGNWRQAGWSGGAASVSGSYDASGVAAASSGRPAGANFTGPITWVIRGDA